MIISILFIHSVNYGMDSAQPVPSCSQTVVFNETHRKQLQEIMKTPNSDMLFREMRKLATASTEWHFLLNNKQGLDPVCNILSDMFIEGSKIGRCHEWLLAAYIGTQGAIEYGAGLLSYKPKTRDMLARKFGKYAKSKECNIVAIPLLSMLTYRYKDNPDKKEILEINDWFPKSSLLRAAETGNNELLSALLDYIPVDYKDDSNRTALMWALNADDRKTLEIVLAQKPEVNAVDNFGYTALMYAAEESLKPSEVELLIAHGADVTLKKSNGETAMNCAANRLAKTDNEKIKKRVQKMMDILALQSTQQLKQPKA